MPRILCSHAAAATEALIFEHLARTGLSLGASVADLLCLLGRRVLWASGFGLSNKGLCKPAKRKASGDSSHASYPAASLAAVTGWVQVPTMGDVPFAHLA